MFQAINILYCIVYGGKVLLHVPLFESHIVCSLQFAFNLYMYQSEILSFVKEVYPTTHVDKYNALLTDCRN